VGRFPLAPRSLSREPEASARGRGCKACVRLHVRGLLLVAVVGCWWPFGGIWLFTVEGVFAGCWVGGGVEVEVPGVALEAVVCQHPTIARVTEGLGPRGARQLTLNLNPRRQLLRRLRRSFLPDYCSS